MIIGLQAYIHGSIAAVELYQKAFGATLGYHVRNTDGTFMHAELYIDEELFLAVSEANNDIAKETRVHYSTTTYPAMNFCVRLKDEQAVKNAYDVLTEDANILYPLGALPWSICCATLSIHSGCSGTSQCRTFGMKQLAHVWQLSIPFRLLSRSSSISAGG